MMYSNSKLNYSVRSRMHAYIPTPIRAPHSHFDIKDHHIIEPRWVCFLFILSILLAAHARDYIHAYLTHSICPYAYMNRSFLIVKSVSRSVDITLSFIPSHHAHELSYVGERAT